MLYSILLVFVLLIPHTTTFWCGECGTYASGYTCFLSSRGAGWYREWSQSLCVQCTNSLCPGDKDGTSIPWNTCPPAQYITRYPDTTQYSRAHQAAQVHCTQLATWTATARLASQGPFTARIIPRALRVPLGTSVRLWLQERVIAETILRLNYRI